MVELGGWEVTEKDLALAGWFPTNMLGKVADGEVNRVRRLSPELSKLCLVGRDDNWDDSNMLLPSCRLNFLL